MNCETVQNIVNDYFEKKLSAEDQNSFLRHVNSCEKCDPLVKKYEKYFELLERAEPGFKPPKDLIDKISDGLMGDAKSERTGKTFDKKELDDTIKKALKTSRKEDKVKEKVKFEIRLPNKKYVAGFLILLGVLSAAILIYMNISFSNEPWVIDVQTGSFSVNGQTSQQHELYRNDVVYTETTGMLRINVPSTSYINMNGSSQLVIEGTEDKGNKIKLVKGSVQVDTYSNEPYLVIESDFAEIVDKHAKYSIEIDDHNTHFIKVYKGIVECDHVNSKIPVGAGYILELRNGYDAGVPYRQDASPVLIEELDKYLFHSGGLESLQNILSASVEADAVTLWNLIKRVDKNEIMYIYDKLNTFYPVPEGVSKRLVMNLKQDVLDLWWNEIEWQL